MPKIPMGRTRPLENPYLIIQGGSGWSWEWRVLKAYSRDPDKKYARWLCAVKSPFTFDSYEWGDTYIEDIHGVVTKVDDEVPPEALPRSFRNDVSLLRGDGVLP